jgi:two-component system nitrogen regulation response regulator NtrX
VKHLLYVGCPLSERPQIEVLLRPDGFAVRWADSAPQALALLDERMSPVLLDLTSRCALSAAREIRRRRPGAFFVAVADPLRPAAAGNARRAGFAKVLERPFTLSALQSILSDHDDAGGGVADNERQPHGLDAIVASSPAMKQVLERLKRIPGDQSGGVLLCGEPGSGRRFIARALHHLHREPGGRLVEVDCAASGGDVELSLFGTLAGDGAARPAARSTERVTRDSLAYQAFGGSLLLLNLADMPARVQGRLVRLLRDGEAVVQGDGKVRAAIRPVACLEPGFEGVLEEGRIRPDLFKRVAATRIDVPPLRHRREDIPVLIEEFLEDICLLAQVPPKAVSNPALTLLGSLPYRGNARELRTLLGTLVEQTIAATIRLEDVLQNLRLDVWGAGASAVAATLRDARAQFEQQYILEVLERHHGRIAEAAKTLGIQRTNLYRKMRTLGVPRRPLPNGGSHNQAH